MDQPLRIVVMSGAEPAAILRLVARIRRDVPSARVCGVLHETRRPKSHSQRMASFVRRLRQPGFARYAAEKAARRLGLLASATGHALLRLIHAAPAATQGKHDFESALRSHGSALHVTGVCHSDEALAFVRGLRPDLGIVYGTGILKPSLFSIPRLGSINIHKRKLPDYRGGGPIGLWELLDGQSEIGVTVHQVVEQLDAGAVIRCATIPIEPFDNLTSLALKAHVVGNDLIVQSVADFARGTVQLTPQQGAGRLFKSPQPHELARCERDLARRRPGYRYRRRSTRPVAKLIAKSLAALPWVVYRNWRRRIRGAFPVSILFHHVISDRPHRLGLSTAQFLNHVAFLRRHYDIVSMRDAVRMLETNAVTRPTVVLSFDDGYRDNFINLRAVVEQTGIPVSMFVSVDHVNRSTPFAHDLRVDCHGFPPLSWAQLKQMRAEGFEIGSHTRTHFDCGSQNGPALEEEIAGSKKELEAGLGERIDFFSFPFGLPRNMSREATDIAARTYPFILSAFGGDNLAPIDGQVKHLKRWSQPGCLWDLELQIQGVLEPKRPDPPASLFPSATRRAHA